MKKNNVCFVTDTWFPIYGGGPKVVLEYAKQLTQKHNFAVTIITRRFNKQDKDYIVFPGIKVVRLGMRGEWNELFPRLSFIFSLFKYLLFHKFDLIHAFPFISGIPAFFAGLLAKTPIVFSLFALRKEGTGAFVERVITFNIPYNLLVTDNPKNIHKQGKRNIIYIPNGVDIEQFDSVKADKSKKARILFVGRFHQQKGIIHLLKVIESIRNKVPGVTFVLVGWGVLEKFIKVHITKKGLKKIVKIKKPVFGKDLVREYKKSHFLVLPSLYEGGGIVVLEAWAAKIPVVVTNVGNFDQIVKNGSNGYVVESNNPKQLELGVLRMIKNNKKAQMGIRGYQMVKRGYTWEKSVAKLAKVYKEIQSI